MARRHCISLMLACLVVMLTVTGLVLAGERFSDNGDGTVTDHVHNLMWAKFDNQGNIDWKQAGRWIRFTFPDTIQARHDDWRMPTLVELQTLYVDDPEYDGYETDCGQVVRITPEIARLIMEEGIPHNREGPKGDGEDRWEDRFDLLGPYHLGEAILVERNPLTARVGLSCVTIRSRRREMEPIKALERKIDGAVLTARLFHEETREDDVPDLVLYQTPR